MIKTVQDIDTEVYIIKHSESGELVCKKKHNLKICSMYIIVILVSDFCGFISWVQFVLKMLMIVLLPVCT